MHYGHPAVHRGILLHARQGPSTKSRKEAYLLGATWRASTLWSSAPRRIFFFDHFSSNDTIKKAEAPEPSFGRTAPMWMGYPI